MKPESQVNQNNDSHPPESPAQVEDTTRRHFISKSAKKAVYIAPLVLLFRPEQAIAASGVSNPGT